MRPKDYGTEAPKPKKPGPWKSPARKRTARLDKPSADLTQLVSVMAERFHWDPKIALDLGIALLRDSNYRAEAADIEKLAYEQTQYSYQESYLPTDVDQVQHALQFDVARIAQFLVLLLEDVNQHDLSRDVDEYFFGPQQQRYPAPYQQHNRDTNVASNQEIIMTQKMSRRRRQRLANRVERARSRETNRNRNRSQERRAERTDSKEERLTRRVASLTRLLRKAERELRSASRTEQRDEQDVRERRSRIAEIRARLDRERRPVRRTAARSQRIRSRLRRRAETRRPARQPRRVRDTRDAPKPKSTRPKARPRKADRREAAPKVIRRVKDGKLYVRVD